MLIVPLNCMQPPEKKCDTLLLLWYGRGVNLSHQNLTLKLKTEN